MHRLLLCAAVANGGFLSQHERHGMKPCTELTPWFVKCIDVEAEQAETDAVVGRPRVGLQELSGDRKRCNLQNKAHDRQGNEGIRIATNVAEAPEAVRAGAQVQVDFETFPDGGVIPVFRLV